MTREMRERKKKNRSKKGESGQKELRAIKVWTAAKLFTAIVGGRGQWSSTGREIPNLQILSFMIDNVRRLRRRVDLPKNF